MSEHWAWGRMGTGRTVGPSPLLRPLRFLDWLNQTGGSFHRNFLDKFPRRLWCAVKLSAPGLVFPGPGSESRPLCPSPPRDSSSPQPSSPHPPSDFCPSTRGSGKPNVLGSVLPNIYTFPLSLTMLRAFSTPVNLLHHSESVQHSQCQ